MAPLVRASALLLGLLVLHVADHTLRQQRSVPAELGFAGTVGLLAVVAVLVLALARRPEAAPYAVIVGVGTAIGFVAVHLLPHWGPFSDPYEALHLDALSWASMLASTGAAVALAAVGAREVSRRRRRARASAA